MTKISPATVRPDASHWFCLESDRHFCLCPRSLITCWSITVLICLACLSAAHGQHTSTVPPNYKGPSLSAFCIANIDGINGISSAPFTVSGYFRSDAELAWAKYAVERNANKPVKGSRCIWSAAAIDPAKITLTNQNGGKITQTGWKFNPQTMLPAATTATIPAAPAAMGTATPVGNSAPNVSATQSQAASTTATSSPAGGVSSIGTSVQQSAQAAQAGVTTAVTGTVDSVATTTQAAVTNTVSNGVTSFMNRLSRKKSDTSAAPAKQDAAPTQPQQPATVAGASPSPTNLAPGGNAAAVSGTGVALTFSFCHLVAAGTEYISDTFPTTNVDQTTLEAAFWTHVGKQYHQANIPYRNNVACVRSATMADAAAQADRLKATASQRGIAAGHQVDTGWTFSGITP